MLRKLIVIALVMIFALPVPALASAVEMTVLDKTVTVEKILYGSEQTGSLVDRVGKIEKDVYGSESKDALVGKLDRVYRYMKDNSTTPSFLIKLNGVEWALSHTLTALPAKARIENLERVMVGNSPAGSLDDRLTKLAKLSYSNGQPEVVGTTINKDTLVKIVLVSPLDTRTSRAGDVVSFQVADDLYAGGILVMGKGAAGFGKVTKVEPSKNFGRDAKLEVTYDGITAMDGSVVDMLLGEKAKEQTKSMATAAGASVAGMVLLGPIGIVGGAFVHGQDFAVPAGTELFIQVKADTDVYGIKAR
jgi:hypothetical protein